MPPSTASSKEPAAVRRRWESSTLSCSIKRTTLPSPPPARRKRWAMTFFRRSLGDKYFHQLVSILSNFSHRVTEATGQYRIDEARLINRMSEDAQSRGAGSQCFRFERRYE